MAVFKCKMCGASLDVSVGTTVLTCDYCGTTQTLPKLDNEKRLNLYDRANHFRRNNEYDKAMDIYEKVLNEDQTDSEAYWSLVLCRYGIEYVEDPATRKRIPTVNRAQFTSIFDDDNYKCAISFADLTQKQVYEEEAKVINEIQKAILAVSKQEKPFDIFICYKETDHNGRRTPDSVLAQELYYQLTNEGFKVFFSRITLEDKLGSAYEPYIFAALNSAKVMVVLGTKEEYFKAVWVRNEWSRYLSLIKNGDDKTLIPAYRDMDPYDLPEEFSHLQAQDMSKLGFMQDLIRGIQKIVHIKEPPKEFNNHSGINIYALLKRAFMFLEDGDWMGANDYCEKVLDQDPENVQAYLCKLMSKLRVSKVEELENLNYSFEKNSNYQKILRFGDDNLKNTLSGYINKINTRKENERLENIYVHACKRMDVVKSESEFKEISYSFSSIGGYKDADVLAQKCLELAENIKKDNVYSSAEAYMLKNSVSDYIEAIKLYESIPGWRNADEKIVYCKEKIEEIKAKEEAIRQEKERLEKLARERAERIAKQRKRITKIVVISLSSIIVLSILISQLIIPLVKYGIALDYMKKGNYSTAIKSFESLDGFLNSEKNIVECNKQVRIQKYKKYLSESEVGGYVYFGYYGDFYIDWIVLEKNNGKLLLISSEVLDSQPYHTEKTDITWEECSLRKWLNEEFYNAAFDSAEKELVSTVTVSAENNPTYATDAGNDTQDQVFLLSISEVEKYFPSRVSKKCQATSYAEKQGVTVNYDFCSWWLRTPGDKHVYAVDVTAFGKIYEPGILIDDSSCGVRPVIWVDIN